VGGLFLVWGLLPAAALLGTLAGFVRHLIGLSGFIALLRLIRLILLCHDMCSSYQQALRVQ
jgi:hypothetical protein